ncbi:Phm7p [Ascoidea rubescens DSM 1968]|uniref:DUF221-domain-containing protein n=1 Tax=Ascoidea rubescens DSM 1968 TaxID=1344418 RepID=A0A1D2VII6_9ASCO|nr:DUF221-domain-containing protein [Ascoidea rubescens DSM 1968]ODV61458.1 DUF221-domain-containing protein [Ascoidea rubescens DSM 1968]
MADASETSSSVSAFLSALILNGIVFLIFITCFIFLRRKEERVYQPRRIVPTVPIEKQPDETPSGYFGWLNHLLSKSQSWIIQQTGVDGFFFLRYLFLIGSTCFIGSFIVLPILLPVNATNGHNLEGLDIISYANIKNKNRTFAHVFLSWIFFGLIIYSIYRELFYYVSFRHSLQATPYIDSLVSSRSLLITSLPKEYNDELSLKSLLPSATTFSFTRNYKLLQKKIEERSKYASKYEATLNKVINKSVKIRQKAIKKEKELPTPEDQLSSYIPDKKRPTHKLKPIIGKKVDTIDYSISHIAELNQEIEQDQQNYLDNEKVGSVFIQFPNQIEAQRAFQALPYHKSFKKSGSKFIINTLPDDIIWENLSLTQHQRRIKKLIAKSVLTAMIIFWAIPVAVVGAISNINYLIDKVSFLEFINNLPTVLLGLITALLPTIMLVILMSLVPPFIKALGKFGGLLTYQEIDLWCHDWYYAFQVIQVFLITTMASAATSVVTKIIDEPDSALTLLASNLPKAANFYICYILLQGLTIPGAALFQVVALILSKILGRLLDNTPRKKWSRFNSLSKPSWGIVFPPYALLGLIGICYSIIAPIVIAFSAVCFLLIYVAYLYNLTYVMDHSIDSRGRHYPKALFQIFVALYLAEVCLIGLFVFNKGWAPVALESILLAATVASHLYFKYKFIPLFDQVPLSALYQAQGNPHYTYNPKDQGLKEIKETGKSFWIDNSDKNSVSIIDENVASTSAAPDASPYPYDKEPTSVPVPPVAENENNTKLPINSVPDYENSTTQEHSKVFFKSTVVNFFHPRKFLTLSYIRSILPNYLNNPIIYDNLSESYLDPAIKDEAPKIWIPKDPMGLSTNEIAKAEGKVFVTDEQTDFDDKGKCQYLGPPPDYGGSY